MYLTYEEWIVLRQENYVLHYLYIWKTKSIEQFAVYVLSCIHWSLYNKQNINMSDFTVSVKIRSLLEKPTSTSIVV